MVSIKNVTICFLRKIRRKKKKKKKDFNMSSAEFVLHRVENVQQIIIKKRRGPNVILNCERKLKARETKLRQIFLNTVFTQSIRTPELLTILVLKLEQAQFITRCCV